jgi:hypothetical protein
MRVEFAQTHLNQYRSRRELKGMPLYTYFNSDNFGTILNQIGYLQMSVISWTLVPYADWFREKLENGIYLYEDNYDEFYQKKLSANKNVASTSAGGTVRGIFNMVQVSTNFKTSLGRDNLVHVDDLSWVWKVSYCRPSEGGKDIFPELIRQIALTSKLSSRSDDQAWKFDGYGNGLGKIPIPPEIEYEWYMRAFSTGDETKQSFTGKDKDGKIVLEQNGADWRLSFVGQFIIKKTVGDPETIPTSQELPVAPNDPNVQSPATFNPHTPSPIPSPSGLVASPTSTGSGLTETQVNIDAELTAETAPEINTQEEVIIDSEHETQVVTDVDVRNDTTPKDNTENG